MTIRRRTAAVLTTGPRAHRSQPRPTGEQTAPAQSGWIVVRRPLV